MKKNILFSLFLITIVLLSLPHLIDWKLNSKIGNTSYEISNEAQVFHETLRIMDWHSDFFLWKRDFFKENSYGHTDLSSLQKGNVAIQMFTIVSKSILGQKVQGTDENGVDSIGLLSFFQLRSPRVWTSPMQRALYQVERVLEASQKSDDVVLVKDRESLVSALKVRESNKKLLMAMMGIEGLHALEGKIENLDIFIDKGVTMFGLHHFFDNKLGGSLHGQSGKGLNDFGRKVIFKLNEKNMIIDLSHSSEEVVKDVLKISSRPIVISHTGFRGHCNGPRNISDELMQEIAFKGGLISVGFWKAAVCDESPKAIVEAIRYGINLVGVDHIALGSDYDGAVKTSFSVDEISVLTAEMLGQGFTKEEIRKVMGENSIEFLQRNLPR